MTLCQPSNAMAIYVLPTSKMDLKGFCYFNKTLTQVINNEKARAKFLKGYGEWKKGVKEFTRKKLAKEYISDLNSSVSVKIPGSQVKYNRVF